MYSAASLPVAEAWLPYHRGHPGQTQRGTEIESLLERWSMRQFCEKKQVWLGQISYLTLDEAVY